MTPIADPRRASNLQLALTLCAAIVAVGGASLWAFVPARLPEVVATTLPAAPAAVLPIERAAWSLALWRPLVDGPTTAAPASAPLKLFSILHRGGEPIAALDPDDGSGLVYARVGEHVHGVTVTSIEDAAVVLASGSGSLRLELPR